VLAPAAADFVLELDYVFQGSCFSLVERFLFLSFMQQLAVGKIAQP
jgi:hypothetical protein